MVRQAAGLAAVPVAPQVRRDHRELFGQARRDEAPVEVRQGIAVQQEQRRTDAAHQIASSANMIPIIPRMNRIWEDSRTDYGWPLVTPELAACSACPLWRRTFGIALQFR